MQFEVLGGVGLHVTRHSVDEAVVALARRQHGVVSFDQLRDAGLGPRAISGRVRRGWLWRIHRGVYAVGALESDLTAATAALAAYGRQAILSHRTAATIWRRVPARPADPVDVTLLNANRRRRQGVRVHYAQAAAVRRRDGLRLTSPAQTLEDLATTSPGELEEAYNEALVLGLVTHQEVRAVAARRPALRAIVEESPGMTRSRMERALRALITKAGLPAPQTNVKVHGYEVDLYWRPTGWSSNSTAGTRIRAAPLSSPTASRTPRSSSPESAS